MFDLILRNGKIVLSDRIIEGDIGILDGKIGKIGKKISGTKSIDAHGCLILPGLIDSHVHFREPGLSQKEDWLSGSSAAAAGGVTTVLDMPNTNPATITQAWLEEKRRIAEARSLVDYGFHFGATMNNIRDIFDAKRIASVKFYRASSTGDLLVDDDSVVLQQFRLLEKRKIPATVHAEDESMIRKETKRLRAEGRMDAEAYSEARPAEAAISSLEKTIRDATDAANKVHICHISAEAEVDLLKKRKNSYLTCEVTPNHLFLAREDYRRLGNLGKMNPPLRTKEDAASLWKALKNGTIDTIASDHAPHLLEEKDGTIWDAPSGAPGIETMLPLLLNEVNKRKLSIIDLVRLTASNPAKIFQLKNKGGIKEGFDADLVVVDMKEEKRLSNADLFTKCGWSPFEGRALKGWPKKTLVRGNLVFDEGNINKNKGTEVDYVIHR